LTSQVARPRSETFEAQREHIFAAAAQCFAKKGYTATTMNEVAAACGVSKATLYHYVLDKHDLLAQISFAHVARLEALVAAVKKQKLQPALHLQALIAQFMQAYAQSQNEHRVLTEDMKFLGDVPRLQVQQSQRRVVQAFAKAITTLRPDLQGAHAASPSLATPLAMLLFGMMNWTFTWLRADGPLTHHTLASVVADLFLGGLPAVAKR
jgi:AcrR family transcriptional regulator